MKEAAAAVLGISAAPLVAGIALYGAMPEPKPRAFGLPAIAALLFSLLFIAGSNFPLGMVFMVCAAVFGLACLRGKKQGR